MLIIKKHLLPIKWPWTIGVFLLFSIYSCRQDNVYTDLISQMQNDEALITMSELTHTPFAVIDPNILDSALARNKRYQHRLSILEESKLSESTLEERNSVLRTLKENDLIWRQWQTDPALYNLSGEVKRLLNQHSLPLNERLVAINQSLNQAKPYYQAAKANLSLPVPERSQLAAQKQISGLRLLSEELPDSIRIASLASTTNQQMLSNSRKAHLQIKDYLAFCESLWFEHMDSLIQK